MSEPKLGEVLSLFEQMAGFHPHEPHWYIPLIGVDPVFQGRGYGSQLLQHGLVACDRDHQPAYLEATSPTNRSLYERHGFRVLGEVSIRRFTTFVPECCASPGSSISRKLVVLRCGRIDIETDDVADLGGELRIVGKA